MPIKAQEFTRIYEGAMVNDGGLSWGVCWIDYDNDEFLDLFVTNYHENNCLYHNNTDGTFTKITNQVIAMEGGIQNVRGSGSCTWGDFDNDGDPDAYIANAVEHSTPDNFFYLNHGDGTFTKIRISPAISESGNSVSTSWIDYDNDGNLDVFVANHPTFPSSHAGANYLFQNVNGEFSRLVNSAIGFDEGSGDHASWADYDNDGDLDLFVPRYMQYNALYENKLSEGKKFHKVLSGIVVNEGEEVYSIGSSWGDYDNDGDLDLFVTNATANNYLYENIGNGNFSKVIDQDIVTDGGECCGSAWGDYDNDGDLDIFLTRGGYFSTKSNLLYRNDGFGNFVRVREGVIATDQNSSNGAAWGDYDRDGDLDLFVSNVLNLNENNALYRNNGNANNWINIKCIGVVSNKSAIGAKVRLKARIGNESRWQLRHISGQTGKCAQNSLNVHFGLGDATIIDSIKIEWPSGKLTVQENISVNQFITIIEEGSTKVAKIIPNASVINTYPNPFIDSITIEYKVNEYSQVTLNIFDLLGKEVKTLINSYESPGTKTQVWDGTNNSGNKLQPGTYQILMQINGVITTKQLILVR
ncbi:FG-GAP-like repeat-containing protein [Bacteroidota bacterium]